MHYLEQIEQTVQTMPSEKMPGTKIETNSETY